MTWMTGCEIKHWHITKFKWWWSVFKSHFASAVDVAVSRHLRALSSASQND